MASTRVILGAAIAVIIAVTMISALLPVVTGNTGTVSVANESITASLNEDVDLQGYEIKSGTVTVYQDQSGTVLPASNYTIDNQPGTFNLTSTDNVADGDTVYVTYDYQATDSTTQTVVDLAPLLIALLALVALANPIQDSL